MTSQVLDPINKQIAGCMGREKGEGDLLTRSYSIGHPIIFIHKIYMYSEILFKKRLQ